MGQVRHGSATTTHAVRTAIQRSQASIAELSRELGVNPKTVAKWRKRQTVEDQKTGPKEPRSTVLSEDEEAMVVAFRRHTLLPLDDCLYALQPSIPHLTRSSLHRCLQRHGISRLPDVEGDKPKRQKFKRYPIGYFRIDIAEVRIEEGKLYLFVAIDRTSKFAVAQLVEKANRKTAWEFLEHLLESVPYRIHTVLTDNGIQFAEQPRNRDSITFRKMRFDMICEANDIEHRLTKPNHPWTNGQVERMNRTIKDATVKRYHYDSHDQLRSHLADFLNAYNFARRLKTLSGLTPYEYICKIWTSEPKRFISDPIHQMPGLNTARLPIPRSIAPKRLIELRYPRPADKVERSTGSSGKDATTGVRTFALASLIGVISMIAGSVPVLMVAVALVALAQEAEAHIADLHMGLHTNCSAPSATVLIQRDSFPFLQMQARISLQV